MVKQGEKRSEQTHVQDDQAVVRRDTGLEVNRPVVTLGSPTDANAIAEVSVSGMRVDLQGALNRIEELLKSIDIGIKGLNS